MHLYQYSIDAFQHDLGMRYYSDCYNHVEYRWGNDNAELRSGGNEDRTHTVCYRDRDDTHAHDPHKHHD